MNLLHITATSRPCRTFSDWVRHWAYRLQPSGPGMFSHIFPSSTSAPQPCSNSYLFYPFSLCTAEGPQFCCLIQWMLRCVCGVLTDHTGLSIIMPAAPLQSICPSVIKYILCTHMVHTPHPHIWADGAGGHSEKMMNFYWNENQEQSQRKSGQDIQFGRL